MKTLVIHPKDHTTDFLCQIYENLPNKTLISDSDKYSVKQINQLIRKHERTFMLGHGYQYGLFSMGQNRPMVIDNEQVPALSANSENLYIWCHAREFVESNRLLGSYSDMFISEMSEAVYCDILDCQPKDIEISNDFFAKTLGKMIISKKNVIDAMIATREIYSTMSNPITHYNSKRLFTLNHYQVEQS